MIHHDDFTNSNSTIVQLERRMRRFISRLTKPSDLTLELCANSTETQPCRLQLEISRSGSQHHASILTSESGFKLHGSDIAPQTPQPIDGWPLILSHGDMTVSIERPAFMSKPNAKVKSRTLSPVLHASVILLFGFILAGIPMNAIEPYNSESFVLSLNPIQNRTETSTSRDALLHMFEKRLKDAGLASSVLVRASNTDQSLFASGTVPTAKATEWENLLLWYDAQNNAGTLVSQVTFEAANPSIPSIAMVKLSEPRAVLLHNGQTLKIGDNLGSMKLLTIEPKKLHLLNGEDTIEFALKEGTSDPN